MDIAAIPRPVEVRRDRVAGVIPAQSPVVRATTALALCCRPSDLLDPLRREIVGQVPPVAAWRYRIHDLPVEGAKPPRDVVVDHEERAATRTSEAKPRRNESLSTRFSSGTSWSFTLMLRVTHSHSVSWA